MSRGPESQNEAISRRAWLALAAAGAVGLALTVVAAAITAANVDGEGSALAAAARASMVAVPVAVGLYAWHQRPKERFGRVLVAAGFGSFWPTLAESGDDVLYSVGRISGWVLLLGLIWLMLVFPSGRLTTRPDRMLVGASAVILVLLYLPSALIAASYPVPSPYTSCDARCPGNAFFLLGSEPPFVGSVVVPVREALTLLLFLAVTAVLIERVRRASSLMRGTLGPVLGVAIVQLVVLAVAIGARRASPDSPAVDALVWVVALAVPSLAAAFFLGLLGRRLHVAGSLQQLGLRVGRGLSRNELRSALSEALEDPSLELVSWQEDQRRWLGADGRAVEPPDPASFRCLTELREGDRLVAGLVHDAALAEQSDFVQAVGSFAVTEHTNSRLSARLEDALREVYASRARILASADRERSRIERDLHDGAQQRLVALRIQLQLIEELVPTDPPAVRKKLQVLGEEVAATLDEIRALARGVYPSLLADRGLVEALRSAALKLPIAASVDPDGIGRYPQEVESAVYFCCLEAMQNASKHAHDAHAVTITLRQDGELSFEVRDDGAGFDEAALQPGAGLTNMHDRLVTVGGGVEVRSTPGSGTVVTGSVPLEGD
jgi:signal transduction histidine kinase